MPIFIGDTTAYTISWLMKEILHSENRHLNAVEKIRIEAEQFGLNNTFLTYEDAPVRTYPFGLCHI
jgi:hypothetical protein